MSDVTSPISVGEAAGWTLGLAASVALALMRAEWEIAARGGLDGAEYTWGDEFTPTGGTSRSSAHLAVLEVSHSVADAETDRKIQNGGNDGYFDQHD